jgi:acid stress-induced BolA-like protein IbaG/YrbA
MENELRKRLKTEFVGAEITVNLDGNRAAIQIVAGVFEGLSRLQRQQRVYGCIADLIESGALHAVTIKTLTPSEL